MSIICTNKKCKHNSKDKYDRCNIYKKQGIVIDENGKCFERTT